MPVNKPGSCFLDALELGLGMPAEVVAAYLRLHFPHCDCDNLGYHATLINVASLELFGIGVTQVDATPVGYGPDGEAFKRDEEGKVIEHLTKWFSRPNFRCVVTGPATYGNREEHANAWNGQVWIDPINPTEALEAPTVDIRSIWVNNLPAPAKQQDPTAPKADAEEESDVDPT